MKLFVKLFELGGALQVGKLKNVKNVAKIFFFDPFFQ